MKLKDEGGFHAEKGDKAIEASHNSLGSHQASAS
jgi:hypothetical protein